MKFLLVLRDNELHWGQNMEQSIKGKGGEAVIITNTQKAEALLRDKQFEVDEIITGSFGSLEGPWRDILKTVQERGMGVTLLTAYPISGYQREVFERQKVRILEKETFDMDQFIAERFSTGRGVKIK